MEEQISEEEKMTNFARDMAEVEDSVAKVSNAVSVLELAAEASGRWKIKGGTSQDQFILLWLHLGSGTRGGGALTDWW